MFSMTMPRMMASIPMILLICFQIPLTLVLMEVSLVWIFSLKSSSSLMKLKAHHLLYCLIMV
ncbi:hypothetical protein PTKIN_Ptkin06aG0102300 [Pterospermum kingtungense]